MKYKFRKSDNLFCECKGMGVDRYRDPSSVIDTLKYAKKELSYSNYDNTNLDIAINVINTFCKEHEIPDKFKRDVK